mmetsp:Transcript_20322/g.52929  ORF Transcript_20322/g.52929 Transcript_20322/m.52929 type:complete len:243 (+) Transcript_20322:103-831(+)
MPDREVEHDAVRFTIVARRVHEGRVREEDAALAPPPRLRIHHHELAHTIIRHDEAQVAGQQKVRVVRVRRQPGVRGLPVHADGRRTERRTARPQQRERPLEMVAADARRRFHGLAPVLAQYQLLEAARLGAERRLRLHKTALVEQRQEGRQLVPRFPPILLQTCDPAQLFRRVPGRRTQSRKRHVALLPLCELRLLWCVAREAGAVRPREDLDAVEAGDGGRPDHGFSSIIVARRGGAEACW